MADEHDPDDERDRDEGLAAAGEPDEGAANVAGEFITLRPETTEALRKLGETYATIGIDDATREKWAELSKSLTDSFVTSSGIAERWQELARTIATAYPKIDVLGAAKLPTIDLGPVQRALAAHEQAREPVSPSHRPPPLPEPVDVDDLFEGPTVLDELLDVAVAQSQHSQAIVAQLEGVARLISVQLQAAETQQAREIKIADETRQREIKIAAVSVTVATIGTAAAVVAALAALGLIG